MNVKYCIIAFVSFWILRFELPHFLYKLGVDPSWPCFVISCNSGPFTYDSGPFSHGNSRWYRSQKVLFWHFFLYRTHFFDSCERDQKNHGSENRDYPTVRPLFCLAMGSKRKLFSRQGQFKNLLGSEIKVKLQTRPIGHQEIRPTGHQDTKTHGHPDIRT